MLYDYSSNEATESGNCSNAECESPLVIVDPPSGAQLNFPTYVTLSSIPGSVIRYTVDGTEPDSLSTTYTGPILIPSSGTVVRALAHTEDCPTGPIATAEFINPSFPFVFSYACDTPDKGGPWGVFTPDGSNDHHWQLQFTLAGATTIKRLELYQLDDDGNWTTGQAWSTDSPIHPWPDKPADEFAVFPLLLFIAAVQQHVAYQSSLGSFGVATHTWDLYGDIVIPAGGLFRLDIILGDGTKLSQTIDGTTCTATPPICPSPATPTVTGKCDGAVDVTFSGTVGRDFIIYVKSDTCSDGLWQEASNGTIDVSPKTVEIASLIQGCLHSFYVSIDEAGCGFRDSSPASATPLLDPSVSISSDKTVVDPNESFTISWNSNHIGGAVCGGCLDGQVSINNSIGCKAGNTPGSQAQSQSVCGLYTYQITGCNTCGTVVSSVQVEVRCVARCPCGLGTGSGLAMPATVLIADSLTFMCPVTDWDCGQPACGPASPLAPSGGAAVWNGTLFHRTCGSYDNFFTAIPLGGCSGPGPGTYYEIRVTIGCSSGAHKWVLSIRSGNGSAGGCFSNWWTGEKLVGDYPDGVYTRVSGCSTHPASVTVT